VENVETLWKTMWKSQRENLKVFHSGKLFPQKKN